eukprot:gene13454-9264_t
MKCVSSPFKWDSLPQDDEEPRQQRRLSNAGDRLPLRLQEANKEQGTAALRGTERLKQNKVRDLQTHIPQRVTTAAERLEGVLSWRIVFFFFHFLFFFFSISLFWFLFHPVTEKNDI